MAEVFQRSIDRINEQLHCDWLRWAHEHQASAWFCEQIIRCLANPLLIEGPSAIQTLQIAKDCAQAGVVRSRKNFSRKRVCERGDLARGTTQPMVGHGASERETILDDIEPIHVVYRRIHPAARSERAHGLKIALSGVEKIAVQSKNNISAVESGNQPRASSEYVFHRNRLFLTEERLVHAPPHVRKNLFQLHAQPLARRRVRLFHQESQTIALIAEECFAKLADVLFKIFARAAFPLLSKSFRPGRIVEIKNRRLNESVGGASRGGMQRIAFELDGTPIHGSGNQRNAAGAPRHRGRVVEKFPGNRPLHVFGKGNQMQFRPTTTR